MLFEPEFRYQSRVPEQIRKSRSSRFFRPLLYQLSYLGETLILTGKRERESNGLTSNGLEDHVRVLRDGLLL